jgi:hypothetical protein
LPSMHHGMVYTEDGGHPLSILNKHGTRPPNQVGDRDERDDGRNECAAGYNALLVGVPLPREKERRGEKGTRGNAVSQARCLPGLSVNAGHNVRQT